MNCKTTAIFRVRSPRAKGLKRLPVRDTARRITSCQLFFFFNDTPTTEIYTLSLHDALPIYRRLARNTSPPPPASSLTRCLRTPRGKLEDRKSTRLNSSHDQNSYAAFCLKKKNSLADQTSYRTASTHMHEHTTSLSNE